ncbi:MAG: type II toxin-antitoxin system Phd/YefM family antitoxin [Planctomycetota bacterium]
MLKQVDTSTLRDHLRDVLEDVSQTRDYVLITRRSKPVSAMVNLDFFEDLLALSIPDYLKGVREAREDYRKGRVAAHRDVFGKLG